MSIFSPASSRTSCVLVCCISLCLLTAGCGELKRQTESVKRTKDNVKRDLQNIQNYGAIDFQTREMLESVYTAYASFVIKRGEGPKNWSDLSGAPNMDADDRMHIRTAKNKIQDVVWGATLQDLGTEEKSKAKLMSMTNELLGNVVIVQANGQLKIVTQQQLAQIPPAE